MNRQQRRAQSRKDSKLKKNGLTYNQGIAIANHAYEKGKDTAEVTQAEIFMYTFGLVLKVLREQWGWGFVRLGRLTNQILEEYNTNGLNSEEIKKWCWEYGGFKLQIDDDTK